jgi:hypothetical protein
MHYGGAVAALIVVGLWVYAALDVFRTDDLLTRRLAKSVWLKFVLFLPFVGSIAWLLIGRPEPVACSDEFDVRTGSCMLGIEEFAQFVAGLQRASAGSRRAVQSWAEQR